MRTKLVLPIIGENRTKPDSIYCFGNPRLKAQIRREELTPDEILKKATGEVENDIAKAVSVTLLLHSARQVDPGLLQWSEALVQYYRSLTLRSFCPNHAQNAPAEFFLGSHHRYILPNTVIATERKPEKNERDEEIHDAEANYWDFLDRIYFARKPKVLRQDLQRLLLEARNDTENPNGRFQLQARNPDQPSWENLGLAKVLPNLTEMRFAFQHILDLEGGEMQVFDGFWKMVAAQSGHTQAMEMASK